MLLLESARCRCCRRWKALVRAPPPDFPAARAVPAAGPPSNPKTKIRAPVPAKDDKPTMGLTSNKNFITANAVDVILAKPGKVPQPDFQWTQKPDYGKVPMYLKRNKDRVAKEKEQFTQFLRMREAPVRWQPLGLQQGGRASG
jgi:hypothetical protein